MKQNEKKFLNTNEAAKYIIKNVGSDGEAVIVAHAEDSYESLTIYDGYKVQAYLEQTLGSGATRVHGRDDFGSNAMGLLESEIAKITGGPIPTSVGRVSIKNDDQTLTAILWETLFYKIPPYNVGGPYAPHIARKKLLFLDYDISKLDLEI